MTDRTLDATTIAEAIRRPSFEMQQAALAAGYASVRDWALSQCVDEIRVLKARVDGLEEEIEPWRFLKLASRRPWQHQRTGARPSRSPFAGCTPTGRVIDR